MTLNPDRLRALRDKRHLSQQELAEKVGVDTGTVSRWERGKNSRPRPRLLKKLCDVLKTNDTEICGKGPLPESKPATPVAQKGQMNLMVDAGCRNAMALVAKRYQVSRQQIIEIAPLLFFIAAEQCLRERRGQLDNHIEALDSADNKAPSHLPFEFVREHDVLDAERKSIDEKDLFGTIIDKNVGLNVADEAKDNPFARFLNGQLKASTTEKVGPVEWEAWDTPIYVICVHETLTLVGNDKKAAAHILQGRVALHEMPTEVRRSSAQEKAKWVHSKYDSQQAEAMNQPSLSIEAVIEAIATEDPEEWKKERENDRLHKDRTGLSGDT